MFLIAAYPSDHEKPGRIPVSEVLMGRSRVGLMDIHNFFNPYVFEVRGQRYSYYTTLIGSHRSRFEWHDQFDLLLTLKGQIKVICWKNRLSVRDSAIVTEVHLK